MTDTGQAADLGYTSDDSESKALKPNDQQDYDEDKEDYLDKDEETSLLLQDKSTTVSLDSEVESKLTSFHHCFSNLYSNSNYFFCFIFR